ncbi:GNAT family N-acetyltransferase [Sphingomonas sp.]|uniref:GNAT family N-acetyltransferase n=1 Tax=Sphingomonas sp. TaxID=28214 RepID=UPI001B08F3C7|nr:GNAT family N-acetyltransferase [Sphingomonas sp.]MBO9714282.1 GNAT family N-acetyltransferase [Sphingomonas sp.]
MFVRTERLTLRPFWPEDAPALARAIGHESVVRNLAKVPWPYALGDAESFVATRHRETPGPVFMIWAHEGDVIRLIGGMGLHPLEDGSHEFGYWLTPAAWGRGYATEAGRGVLQTARHTLRLKRVVAGHFVDNPASGRVLRKLGFCPTGKVEPRHSVGRGGEAPCATFELELGGDGVDCNGPQDDRMAVAA